MSYLLDTNIVSEWVRPRPEPRVSTWLDEVDEERAFISVATLAELELGVALLPKGKKRDQLEAWLAGELTARFEGRVINITTAIAREWGVLNAQMQRSGKPMGVIDSFLAATARVHDLTLVTRNEADFTGTGLKVLNPWKDDRRARTNEGHDSRRAQTS